MFDLIDFASANLLLFPFWGILVPPSVLVTDSRCVDSFSASVELLFDACWLNKGVWGCFGGMCECFLLQKRFRVVELVVMEWLQRYRARTFHYIKQRECNLTKISKGVILHIGVVLQSEDPYCSARYF